MDVLVSIQNKLKAPKGQFNDFGKYKYRNCEDILEAVKPLLKESETALVISDDLMLIGERYYVKAVARLMQGVKVIAESSAFAREAETKKGMDVSQVTGAASSYARKYALNGLFAIDDTKDADSGKQEEPKGKDATPPLKEPKKTTPPEKAEPTLKQIIWGMMKKKKLTDDQCAAFGKYVGAKTDKEKQTFIDTFEAQYEAWKNEPEGLHEIAENQ